MQSLTNKTIEKRPHAHESREASIKNFITTHCRLLLHFLSWDRMGAIFALKSHGAPTIIHHQSPLPRDLHHEIELPLVVSRLLTKVVGAMFAVS